MRLVRALILLAPFALASGGGMALAMLTGCSRVQQAPSVSYTLLDGRKTDLATLRGHVVLVNFWATDCAPCVAEMPQLADTWQRFAPQGFETLAVAMRYDPPFAVSNFAHARRLPFGVVIDNTGEIADRFGGVAVTPTTLLIDKRGRIVDRWIGSTDFKKLQTTIERLVQEP